MFEKDFIFQNILIKIQNLVFSQADERESPANTHQEYTWPESYPPSREVTPVPPPRLRKIRKRKVVPPSSRVLRSHARLAKSAAGLAAAALLLTALIHWLEMHSIPHPPRNLESRSTTYPFLSLWRAVSSSMSGLGVEGWCLAVRSRAGELQAPLLRRWRGAEVPSIRAEVSR